MDEELLNWEKMDEELLKAEKMDEELMNAAIKGDVEFLRKAIASEKPDEYFKSVHERLATPFEIEIETETDFDWKSNMFHLAVWHRKVEFLREAMEKLPKHVVNFLLCAGWCNSPFHVAAKQGSNKIVKVILDYYEKSLSASSDDDHKKPWLVHRNLGTPFHLIMKYCSEKCALTLLSIDVTLFSKMIDQPLGWGKPPIISALKRGFNRVVSKFMDSDPNWDPFDIDVLDVLDEALAFAPNCSDEIFRWVLEKNLQLVKYECKYDGTDVLIEWATIGRLYPFEYVLKSDVHASSLKRYLIRQMSPWETLLRIASDYPCDDTTLQIVRILIDTYKVEKGEQLSTSQAVLPWLKKDVFGKSCFDYAVVRRFEKLALYFLSLNEAESLLESDDQILFTSIEKNFPDLAHKILELVQKYGLTELLTSDTGRTILHDVPKCKALEPFLTRVLKLYPQLMKERDEEGVNVLHSWIKMGELWPFECILKRDDIDRQTRDNFLWLVHHHDKQGRNPLQYAAMFGAEGAVVECIPILLSALLEHPSHIHIPYDKEDSEGHTPITKAISNGREKLVLCILSNLRTTNEWGRYTFHDLIVEKDILFKAAESNCHQLVKYILNWVYQSQVTRDFLHSKGQNLLHIGSKCSEENCVLMVEKFPELINQEDQNGKTPLDRASEASATWLVELILKKDPSSILKADKAWVEACKRSHLPTVLVFIDHSRYLRHICREQEDTPLHHLKGLNYSEYQELLARLPMKELKNAQDSNRKTPLHKAIENKDMDFAEVLLGMSDVDRSIKDKDSKTAMDLLKEVCRENEAWKQMCQRIGVDPYLKTAYIRPNTDLDAMRNIVALVAALLATITFTVGLTLPGGFNSDNGEAILAKEASFLVFLITDAYAMCWSMLILFCTIWSLVCDRRMAELLIDRSLVLLKHSLYGTLLAFMMGVYAVIHQKSLWAAIVIISMCSLMVILAGRTILYKLLPTLPAAHEEYKFLRLLLNFIRSKKEAEPSNNQNEVEERAPLNHQDESEVHSTVQGQDESEVDSTVQDQVSGDEPV